MVLKLLTFFGRLDRFRVIVCLTELARVSRGHLFKPHWSPEFFSGFLFLCNCINCVHNYEEHSSFCFLTLVIVNSLIPSCYRPLRAYPGRYAIFFCHLAVYPQTWPRVAEVYNSVEFRITRETCVDHTAKRKHVLAMQWNPDFSNLLLGKWSPFVVQFYEVVDAIPKHLLTKAIYRKLSGELSDHPLIQPLFNLIPH